MIVERTQEGKAIARQTQNLEKDENPRACFARNSYNQVVEKTGISKSTLIRALKKRQISK